MILHFQGRELHVNNTVLSTVSSCTLHSTTIQSSVLTVESTHTAYCETAHTEHPFIASDVNPFLPSAVTTVSGLFIRTDHCIGVTGDVSDTKSVSPSVRMLATVPQ
ncbi:unnamed protein product [Staurois parvus]|uniref:Uncharacterized protein n=1 Tax=Staurois parvus TaxID=386267 RepID=A0ABN9AQC8_9NEOB|nr:unnamed protein product [Staurois parvus]